MVRKAFLRDLTRVRPHFCCAQKPEIRSRIVGATHTLRGASIACMIRKLKSGEFRIYSRKKDAKTGKRRNLGTFPTMEKAKQHEREVQYFKHH